MASVNPYLTFKDTCEKAFNFYKSVFGGEFQYIGRFKEMPPQKDQPPIPASEGDLIMHVSLPIGNGTILMGSDSGGGWGQGLVAGNNFSLSVSTDSNAEADRIFNTLSAGGKATMPMNQTFWGSYFGTLTDKFGINWMVSCDAKR